MKCSICERPDPIYRLDDRTVLCAPCLDVESILCEENLRHMAGELYRDRQTRSMSYRLVAMAEWQKKVRGRPVPSGKGKSRPE